MSTAHDLAARRHELVGRSRTLRAQLAADVQILAPALTAVDRVRLGVQWVRHNPLWVGVVVTALVVWRPSRLWRWGSKLWSAWRLYRRLQVVWLPGKR